MKNRAFLMAVAILAADCCVGLAQTMLEWKLNKGETFYIETVTTRKGSSTLDGKVSFVEAVETVVAAFKVVDVKEGGYVLEEEILLVRNKQAMGATSLSRAVYKSRLEPDPDAPKPRKGAAFKIVLQRNGQIEFTGHEEALKPLAIESKAALKTFKELMPEAYWKGFVADVFSILPSKPVATGDTWMRPFHADLGALGGFTATYRHALKSTTSGTAIIDTTMDLKHSRPKKAASSLVFKITDTDIEFKGAKGTIGFDVASGRLLHSEMRLPMKGSVALEAGDKKVTLQVDQIQTVVTRLLKSNPLMR